MLDPTRTVLPSSIAIIDRGHRNRIYVRAVNISNVAATYGPEDTESIILRVKACCAADISIYFRGIRRSTDV